MSGQASPRRRRVAVPLLAMLAVLAGVHAAGWWWVSGRVLAAVPEMVAGATAEGWAVAFGPPARGGYPFAARIRLPALVARRAMGAATLRVTMERLDLVVTLADPGAIQLAPGGVATVGPEEAPADSWRVTADAASLRVPFAAGPATLRAEGLLVQGNERAGLRAATLDARFLPGVMTAAATGLVPIPAFSGAFAAPAALSFRALFSPQQAASAAAWRDANGMVALPELSLSWGPLAVEGHVRGGLDARLQPHGQGELVTRGAPELLDAAGRAGLITPPTARAGQAVLGLLAMATGGGPVRLPLVLEDRTLVVAQFPLATLPAVSWPEP